MSKIIGFIIIISIVGYLLRSPVFWIILCISIIAFIIINQVHKNAQTYNFNTTNTTSNNINPATYQTQDKNIMRILSESSSIISNTRDLSTFISRNNIIFDKLYETSPHAIEECKRFRATAIETFPASISSCVDRVILDASKFSTSRGKQNHLQKNINVLKNEPINSIVCQSAVNFQINRLTQEFSKIESKSTEVAKLSESKTINRPNTNIAKYVASSSPEVKKSIEMVSTSEYHRKWYISISFGKSSSKNFDKALFLAKQANLYIETEFNEKLIFQSIYTHEPQSYLSFIRLYEIVGNWKSSFVIINDNLIDRKIVGGLNYCYGDMCRNGRSKFCFGASEYTENPFGCHRLQISASNHPWWQFSRFDGVNYNVDKQAIRERIDEYSTAFRCFPNFDYDKIMAVFDKIPNSLNEDEFKELEMDKFFLGKSNNFLQ